MIGEIALATVAVLVPLGALLWLTWWVAYRRGRKSVVIYPLVSYGSKLVEDSNDPRCSQCGAKIEFEPVVRIVDRHGKESFARYERSPLDGAGDLLDTRPGDVVIVKRGDPQPSFERAQERMVPGADVMP